MTGESEGASKGKDMPSLSAEYRRYLRSVTWFVKRREALRRAGYRCGRCGAPVTNDNAHVHHLTYERLGAELPEDLSVMCRECHPEADAERRSQKAADTWYARVDGWATKVHGDYWEEDLGWEAAEEEFSQWLEDGEPAW